MSQPSRVPLALEPLEARENPSLSTENSDSVPPPALPAGWTEWSSDGSDIFSTAAAKGAGGSTAVVTQAGSRTSGLAWHPQRVPADAGLAVTIRLDTLVPVSIFTRGNNLGTSSQSYLAAVVTRPANVDLWEVSGGVARLLGSVASPPSAYYSGWARVTLVPTGTTATVQLVRQDTGQYLNAQGTWQSTATNALSATTSPPPADGFVGIGR